MSEGLLFETSDGRSRFLLVPGHSLTLGRKLPCDIVVRSRVVASEHVRLRGTEAGFTAADANSPGGTYLNDERLVATTPIGVGDRLKLAGNVIYTARAFCGESLWDRLSGEPMPIPAALSMARSVLLALEPLHGAGDCHGDLSPHEVLLAQDGSVELLIRGHRALSADGERQCNPRYVAPEAFGDAGLEPASDLYSLGCMLYQTITGRDPFPTDTAQNNMMSKLFGAPPPCDADWPGKLVSLLITLLSLDPAERPTIADAVERIERLVGTSTEPSNPARWWLAIEGETWGVLEWCQGTELSLCLLRTAVNADARAFIEQRFVEFTGHRDEVRLEHVIDFVEVLLPHALKELTSRRDDKAALPD